MTTPNRIVTRALFWNSRAVSALSPHFEHLKAEAEWYSRWEKAGYFKPDLTSKAPPFCIVIPPPNVTGVLHMGHGLDGVLQDTLVRYKRMCGFNTLWIVGTDHAGIATQNVVERELRKEGKRKEDLGREAFVDLVWKWKEKHHAIIAAQIRRIGCSVDWSRERFTMDEGLSRAVVECFVRLYRDGLIYRGERLTNWCVRCQTALSDLEVIPKEVVGKLYQLKYPFSDGSGALIIATTRPETFLADTAVAVNPEDERFREAVQKRVRLPLLDREIPVIADAHVDKEFGTGALKVTPGHDFNDFEIGVRHQLPILNLITSEGKLTDVAGPYQGVSLKEARDRIVADLRSIGALVSETEHGHSVGHCQRCDTVAEPILTTQWFVKMKPLAEVAQTAVENRETRILPESWKPTWDHWLSTIRDWCISRQLWWGHRIPAYHCSACGEISVSATPISRCEKCRSDSVVQDPDVLDTWFSSALWPFSTLGWPEKSRELELFYPNSVLITGFDILFFWVARMMMAGLKMTGTVPFRDVFLHALILDQHGKKMSKSSGNALDPLAVCDRFGTDAFRFTMVALSAQGRNIRLSENVFVGYRNFTNKLWNAAKLILSRADGVDGLETETDRYATTHWATLDTVDRYLLSELSTSVAGFREAIEQYQFDRAALRAYQFVWHELCDWYLEAAKLSWNDKERTQARAQKTRSALIVLRDVLKLLHPMMPFVTEEIWAALPSGFRDREHVMVSPFPIPAVEGKEAERARRRMEDVKAMVTFIRSIRGEHGLAPGSVLQAFILAPEPDDRLMVEKETGLIEHLARAKVAIAQNVPVNAFIARGMAGRLDSYVMLEGVVDKEKELVRLEKEVDRLKRELEKTRQKLARSDFKDRAPEEIVQQEVEKEREFQARVEKLSSTLTRLR